MGRGVDPSHSPPCTLTSDFCLTSGLRSASLHFRQEPPSNLRATHFRALTGRGTPTGNEGPAKMPAQWREPGGSRAARLVTPPLIRHAREKEFPSSLVKEPRPRGGSDGGVSKARPRPPTIVDQAKLRLPLGVDTSVSPFVM